MKRQVRFSENSTKSVNIQKQPPNQKRLSREFTLSLKTDDSPGQDEERQKSLEQEYPGPKTSATNLDLKSLLSDIQGFSVPHFENMDVKLLDEIRAVNDEGNAARKRAGWGLISDIVAKYPRRQSIAVTIQKLKGDQQKQPEQPLVSQRSIRNSNRSLKYGNLRKQSNIQVQTEYDDHMHVIQQRLDDLKNLKEHFLEVKKSNDKQNDWLVRFSRDVKFSGLHRQNFKKGQRLSLLLGFKQPQTLNRKDTLISQIENNSESSDETNGQDYDGSKFKRELIKRHIKVSMRNHFKKKLNLTSNNSMRVDEEQWDRQNYKKSFVGMGNGGSGQKQNLSNFQLNVQHDSHVSDFRKVFKVNQSTKGGFVKVLSTQNQIGISRDSPERSALKQMYTRGGLLSKRLSTSQAVESKFKTTALQNHSLENRSINKESHKIIPYTGKFTLKLDDSSTHRNLDFIDTPIRLDSSNQQTSLNFTQQYLQQSHKGNQRYKNNKNQFTEAEYQNCNRVHTLMSPADFNHNLMPSESTALSQVKARKSETKNKEKSKNFKWYQENDSDSNLDEDLEEEVDDKSIIKGCGQVQNLLSLQSVELTRRQSEDIDSLDSGEDLDLNNVLKLDNNDSKSKQQINNTQENKQLENDSKSKLRYSLLGDDIKRKSKQFLIKTNTQANTPRLRKSLITNASVQNSPSQITDQGVFSFKKLSSKPKLPFVIRNSVDYFIIQQNQNQLIKNQSSHQQSQLKKKQDFNPDDKNSIASKFQDKNLPISTTTTNQSNYKIDLHIKLID
ncbi:UNKNOWN [Stylonychia lemnae]|uniref:Uncharacterized protein n=1 Tax=Stylonychia lemnae TaxID=5949 RepID=A0A078B435_STYLE|nr:UNKNOWN [Stylonychia lemnae]|eukprot:CDW89006.1 UNKNOWN [Stylonychia lemnae]